ncbi:nuclear transport factor 2 family protein [Actinophytocola oryzae]|uniref:SnoaL-like protein n=1 Tax=Actinophytocola oryzae TaxID=502181 RepID=A0A4R7VRN6_9PSEU|nr:nuclear transport factor 2 family protein [Actinophytocola oryzae]TDV52404.1 SnoaL-like protein [Actinophytocola oryzae]
MSIEDFRTAARTKDIELAMGTLADDVVLRSPLTDRFTFDGREDVRRLFETAYEKFDGLDYHTVIGGRVLIGGATAGGQPFEETLVLDLNGAGKITELTLFIRPLTGLTAVLAALGPTLARKNGRRTAGLLRIMAAPLVAATRSGDRVGIGLALPRRRG